MNGLIDDITADGWMALAICILRGVPPDEGFKLLYNPARKNIKWNEEMFEEIELMRRKGMKWTDIGGMYQVDGTGICRAYHRYKGRPKGTHQKHSEEFYKQIDEMRKRGMAWKDISEKMGISVSNACSLYQWWKKKKEREHD